MRRSTDCEPTEAHIVSAETPVTHGSSFLGKFGFAGTVYFYEVLQRMQLPLCEESETPRKPSLNPHVTR